MMWPQVLFSKKIEAVAGSLDMDEHRVLTEKMGVQIVERIDHLAKQMEYLRMPYLFLHRDHKGVLVGVAGSVPQVLDETFPFARETGAGGRPIRFEHIFVGPANAKLPDLEDMLAKNREHMAALLIEANAGKEHIQAPLVELLPCMESSTEWGRLGPEILKGKRSAVFSLDGKLLHDLGRAPLAREGVASELGKKSLRPAGRRTTFATVAAVGVGVALTALAGVALWRSMNPPPDHDERAPSATR